MPASEHLPDTHELLEQISDGFLQVDADWRVVYLNAAAADALRRTDLAGKSLRAEFAGLEDSAFGDACRRARETQQPQAFDAGPPAFRGRPGRVFPAADGFSIYLQPPVGALREESEQWMRTLANSSPCALVLTRWDDGAFLYTNRHLRELMGGITEDEALTHFASEFLVNPTNRAVLLEALASQNGVYRWEGKYRRLDGTEFWLSGASKRMRYKGEPVALSAFQDTTEMRRCLEEAWEEADHDSLTGLFNHRGLYKRLDALAAENSPLAVVLLDLDGFKFFNDAYGHETGDEVLRLVAAALRGVCRFGDVPARFGGDEFALLLPVTPEENAENSAGAAATAARLEAAFGGLSYTPPGHEAAIPITLSLGVALFPQEAADARTSLHLAGERLRLAKSRADTDSEVRDLRESLQNEIAGFTMLDALVTAVDNKDRYTRRHSEDVLRYSGQIAAALGLDAVARRTIEIAALLHDAGKIGIPDAILRKPGRLTAEELAAVQLHAALGAVFVSAVPGLEEMLDAVRHHHERWDGGGYPDGLKGEAIPLPARIMAVADAYSAMTTDRPYRKGMEPAKALAILEEGAGTQWDPQCVRAFVSISAPDQAQEASEPRRL